MAKFTLKTTAQVQRTFVVEADDQDQAKRRFTNYKHDPEAFAPGIIIEQADEQIDLTLQRISEITPVPQVRVVESADEKPEPQAPPRAPRSRAAAS
jgi:hypothetical protein